MAKKPPEQDYSDEEAARRRDDLARRILRTPPQPHAAPKAKPLRPDKGASSKGGKKSPA